MSTYNGAKFIREQIESVLNQSVDVRLIIRDDGSTDETLTILKEYEEMGKIELHAGENIGVVNSFFCLLRNAPTSDYYAFCDQDDFWLPNKLEVAINFLKSTPSEPYLYCSDVVPVNENLERINVKAKKRKYKLTFAESLVQAVAPGCTFVFNNKLKELFSLAKNIENVSIHDWFIHKLCAACGKVYYDENAYNYLLLEKKGIPYGSI